MKNSSASDSYLETQIVTATPQKLRLLLIEGAIRNARRTSEFWAEQRDEAALESLIRCRAIISELLAGVRSDGSDLCQRVIALYSFLFQRLTAAQQQRNPSILAEVIDVLAEERLTWQQLCEQMPAAPDAAARGGYEPSEIAAPRFVPDFRYADASRERISFDA